LIPRPSNEVLVESFGLAIKRHDMHTLADLNWLNDEVSLQYLWQEYSEMLCYIDSYWNYCIAW
jgi:Ulp1 family protease